MSDIYTYIHTHTPTAHPQTSVHQLIRRYDTHLRTYARTIKFRCVLVLCSTCLLAVPFLLSAVFYLN